MPKTKRQIGKGLTRWLGYERASNIWCHSSTYKNLRQALTAHIEALFESDDPIVASIKSATERTLKLDEDIYNLVRQIKNSRTFRGSFGRCNGNTVRASDEETANIDKQINDLIVERAHFQFEYADPFRPFLPLMKKFSNVVKLCLLTNGDQNVFLIADKGGANFCREKGNTPFAEIMLNYLERSPYRAHFITTVSKYSYTDTLAKGAAKVLSKAKNEEAYLYPKKIKFSTFELVQILAKFYANHEKKISTVSVIEFVDFEDIFHFFGNMERHKQSNANDPIFYYAQRFSIDSILKPKWASYPNKANTLADHTKNDEAQRSAFIASSSTDKELFVQASYEKFRRKFNVNHDKQPSWENYKDGFFEFWDAQQFEEKERLNEFYICVNYFFSCVYACFLMTNPRRPDPQCKNVVLYLNPWQVDLLICILKKKDYADIEFSSKIEFDNCDEEELAEKLAAELAEEDRQATRLFQQSLQLYLMTRERKIFQLDYDGQMFLSIKKSRLFAIGYYRSEQIVHDALTAEPIGNEAMIVAVSPDGHPTHYKLSTFLKTFPIDEKSMDPFTSPHEDSSKLKHYYIMPWINVPPDPAQDAAQLQSPAQAEVTAEVSAVAAATPRDPHKAFERLKEIGPDAIKDDFNFCTDHYREFRHADGRCRFKVIFVETLEVKKEHVDAFCSRWGRDKQNKVALVYHGTSETGRREIIRTAIPFVGKSAFGRGVYFGTDPLTAMRYNTDNDDRTNGATSTKLLVCAVLSNSFNHTDAKRPKNYVVVTPERGTILPMFLVHFEEPAVSNYGNETLWELQGDEPVENGLRLNYSSRVTKDMGGRRTQRRAS